MFKCEIYIGLLFLFLPTLSAVEITTTEEGQLVEPKQKTVDNVTINNGGWQPKKKYQKKSGTNDLHSLRMATICETPNQDEGYCVPLKNCSKLLDQVENKEARQFLKQSSCGPKNQNMTNPRVCCGKYDNFIQIINQNPLPKNCGYQAVPVRGRILGGKEANLGEFPWMARLIHKNSLHKRTFGCSGFLITASYVLTAGHCLESDNVDIWGPVFEVQLGEHNTETEIDCHERRPICADKPEIIRVRKNIVHPNYDRESTNHYNDIGLLHLKKSAIFSNYVSPICLAPHQDKNAFEYWISGWGSTQREMLSTVKMKVSLPPYPHDNCTYKYRLINVQIVESQICVGGVKGKDSCNGDSGGPLMQVKDRNHWYAVGIVSFGLGCGKEGWPGVYTNIPSYLDWIKTTIIKRATNRKNNKRKSEKSDD